MKPVVFPPMPPQFVACSGRAFYRITPKALEVFEASAEIPPPQLRGSATATQMARIAIHEASNLIPVADRGVLVIAKEGVFRYDKGRKQARARAPIPAPAPLFAWADSKNIGDFWVRSRGEHSVRRYALAALAPSGSSPVGPATNAGTLHELAAFDGRLFSVLSNGTPVYSTSEGLMHGGQAPSALPVKLPAPPKGTTLLFADASPDRFWSADSGGNLGLWDGKQNAPITTAHIPGGVIDAAHEGDRVAVLSMELSGRRHQPVVTLFSNGRQEGQLRLGASPASRPQPELDLCLLSGRPWVVVGGPRWMQLFDWSAPRLLAEW